MRRIASGDATQVLFFQRQTGLSGFTVYRKRGSGSWTAMTTPTVTEADSTNAPGIYGFVVDEDTTITAGKKTEGMAFYITAAGMQPVFLQAELFILDLTHVRGEPLVEGGAAPDGGALGY